MRGMQKSGVTLPYVILCELGIPLRVIFAVHLNLHPVVVPLRVFARLCPCCKPLLCPSQWEKKRQVVGLRNCGVSGARTEKATEPN